MIALRSLSARGLAAALFALCIALPFTARGTQAQSIDNFASDVVIVVQAKTQASLYAEPRNTATVTATLLRGGSLHVINATIVSGEIWWLLALPPPSAQAVGWAKATDLEIVDIFLRDQYRYPAPVTAVISPNVVVVPFIIPVPFFLP